MIRSSYHIRKVPETINFSATKALSIDEKADQIIKYYLIYGHCCIFKKDAEKKKLTTSVTYNWFITIGQHTGSEHEKAKVKLEKMGIDLTLYCTHSRKNII